MVPFAFGGTLDRIGRLLGTYHADPEWGAAAVANGNGKAAAAPAERKAVDTTGVQFFSPDGRRFFNLSGQPRSDVAEVTRQTAYAAAAYAYVAIRYRAEKSSEPPLVVVEKNAEGEEAPLPDHLLAGLLEDPSPDLDMGELVHLTRIYRDTTGGALWVLNESIGGDVGMITVFDHDQFEVAPATVEGTRRMFGLFQIKTRTGERTLTPDQVVYWREPNPYSWSRGLAPLDVVLAMLNLGKQAQATVKDILRNALFPSVVIQADKEWSPDEEEWERFKHQLDQHAEREKKGGPLALTGGGRTTVVSQDLTGLMPDEILDRVEATTAAVFGIPAVVLSYLVGLKNSPWSQMSEARRMAYEDTIEPIWKRDGKTLTRQLLRRMDPDPRRRIKVDTSEVRALQLDRKLMSEISVKTKDIGTRNERRALLGWDPLGDERGDEIVGDSPMQVDLRQQGEGQNAGPGARERKGARLSEETKRDLAWIRFDVQTKAQEPVWRRAAAKQLEADARVIGKLAEKHLREAKEADPPSVDSFLGALEGYLTGDARKAWDAVVQPLIEATGITAVEAVASELGVVFDVLQPGVLSFTEKHAAELIVQVTDTTKEAVRGALQRGLEAGDSVPNLAKRIRETDSAFGKARSELIARTETATVTNGSQRDSLADYAATEGVTVEKSWLSSRDSRVRDEHQHLDDGKWIPVDQPFANGDQYPQDPNERCTTIYRIPED